MSELRFAVAGSPLSTPPPGGTVAGLKQTKKLGISAMEIEWVQSVPKSVERMQEIKQTATELGITLTVHAPYYVNLNSPEPEKLAASKKRVIDALAMSEIAGVRSVCVHAAFNLGRQPEEVYDNVSRAVDAILKKKATLFPNVNLAIETMGKPGQFGTLEEALRISKQFDLYPTIDSAHMHARSNGAWNTAKEWNELYDLYEKYLGKKSLTNMHMHYCGIAYGEKGEKHHLPLKESDANWKDFVKVLKERKIGGTVVVESPIQEEDTLLLQREFAKL
ncbi:MAG: TIM barrel protein [Candidatus Peribacteraceae bacterium]|nr:TIM barrel protein [Candidatus Peribacteraceae bacterium]